LGNATPGSAREWGYEPRPQEPHSLRQSAVTGDVPSESEIRQLVTDRVTDVKFRRIFSD